MTHKLIVFITISTGLALTFLTDLNQYWSDLNHELNFDLNKQSYCFDQDGQYFGKNLDLKVKPASVTKLYTSLWALDSLGKNFRFQTKIEIKDNDLYILGGSDPFFVTENLFLIMDHLYKKGYEKFDKVYFSEDFYFNWSDSPSKITGFLREILNTNKWSPALKNTFNKTNQFIRKHTQRQEINIPHFQVKQVLPIRSIRLHASDESFFFKSSPLWLHLKQVNMFSNNFYTDKVFSFLGGSEEFSDYIYTKISATKEDIYFYTGSGLGDNYTTCRTTLDMLNALEEVIYHHELKLEQVIAVPGIDNGTLKKRFTDSRYTKKLVAKTGTLRDTSTLAGYLLGQKSVKFGVFNSTNKRTQARELQNKFVQKSIDLFTDREFIQYQSPHYLSIKESLIHE